MDWARPCWPGRSVEPIAFCSVLVAWKTFWLPWGDGICQYSTNCSFCYQDGHSLANEKHLSAPNMTLRFIWIVCYSSEQHISEVKYTPKDTANVPFIFPVIDSPAGQIPRGDSQREGLTHCHYDDIILHRAAFLDARQMTGSFGFKCCTQCHVNYGLQGTANCPHHTFHPTFSSSLVKLVPHSNQNEIISKSILNWFLLPEESV